MNSTAWHRFIEGEGLRIATELLMVNTETFENGVPTKGRQTNWRVNRSGRSFNTHYHWTHQNNDFDVTVS